MAERLGPRIDLLVTDMVMPQMGGLDLAERLRQSRAPPARPLHVGLQRGQRRPAARDRGRAFLQKPFTGSALARRVREVLGQG